MKDDYPIYFKWKTFLRYILDLTTKYPKTVRFNVVDRITDIAFDIIEEIVEAIYAKDKKNILGRIHLDLEKMRVLMQIRVEQHDISIKQYEHASKEIQETGKMIGGDQIMKRIGGLKEAFPLL